MSYYYSNGPITTKIITDETFRVHQGFDMALLDDMTMPPSNLLTFEVAGREPFLDFKSTLARKLGYPLNHFRVWVLSASRLSQGYREEVKIIRVSRVVPEDDPELTMDKIRKMGSNTPGLILYVEVLDPEREALPAGPKENQRMVFVKYFDAINQKLDGVGHFYVNRRGSDLKEFVRTRNNLHPNARIDFYKEIGPGETNIRKDFTSGYSEEVCNGDIFCFQVELPDQAIAELRRQKLCVDLEEFYKFLQNRVLITFKPRHDAMATTIQFSLVLSETFTYDQMAQLVSAKLHHEPEKLRFTSSHEGNPQTVILRTSPRSNSWRCSPETITVDKMIRPPGADTSSYSKSKPNNVLFYELLDLPTGEVHRKRMVTVTWTGAQNREEGKYSMLMPTTCSMHEVANKLSTMVQFSKNSSRKIRLFTIQDGKVQTPFTGEELLWTVLDVENIYAAEASTMTMKQYDPSAMLKMLQFVVKLKVDGSNYQQWLKALESVLGMATGKAGILTLPGHTLSPSEDLMIKQAIMASVDDALVLTVLEAESGMVAFAEIQKRYTLKSRSGHIRLMKEILKTKFDLHDRTAEVDAHFRKIDHLAETLFDSGFQLTRESFKGLLFHLSLPELDMPPFLNICKRIDAQPGGATTVSNKQLVKIAQTELAQFRQRRQNTSIGPSKKCAVRARRNSM